MNPNDEIRIFEDKLGPIILQVNGLQRSCFGQLTQAEEKWKREQARREAEERARQEEQEDERVRAEAWRHQQA